MPSLQHVTFSKDVSQGLQMQELIRKARLILV